MTLNAKKIAYRWIFFQLLFAGTLLAETNTISLQPRPNQNAYVRVKTVVEVAGSLSVESNKPKKAANKSAATDKTAKPSKPTPQRQIPLKVDAELFYDEMRVAGGSSASVRHYWDAKADFVINESTENRQLREDRRLVRLTGDSRSDRFWSPDGNLSREEVELLDIPGNASPPEVLLPKSQVALNDQWDIEPSVAAQFFRIDEITDGQLVGTVKEITDEQVKLELTGEVTGNADGAETKIEIKGDLHFDRKQRFLDWVAFAMREKREIGFAAPGFDVVARIRCARKSVESSTALSTAMATFAAPKGELLLEYVVPKLSFQAALDRRWHAVQQDVQSSLLRLVDEGDLLATCKIDRLTRMPAGQQITLSGFQSDVRTALAQNCKQIVSVSEDVSQQGVRILRVTAEGVIEETPIRWVYYHLSNDAGQRLSLIVTHEASLETRIADAHQALVNSILILPQEEAATTLPTTTLPPTAAAQTDKS